MKHLNSKLAVLAVAVSGFAAQAQESKLQLQIDAASAAAPVGASQPLTGVVVTGHSNALLRSDQRLAMLKASLPLGTDGSAAESGGLRHTVAVFPQEPNAATGAARQMMERSHTPPAGSDSDGDIAAGTW